MKVSCPASIVLSVLLTSHALAHFDYDSCQNILRHGIQDELSSNNSKQHKITKHFQFCAIAKKNNLSTHHFEHFASTYSKHLTENSNERSLGGSSHYGLFSLDADFSEGDQSKALSQNEIRVLLKRNKQSIVEYFEKNCGESSYEEHLASEANLITKIANKDIVESWKTCMVKKQGTFSYPIFMDEDLLLFSIRAEYHEIGPRNLTELSLEWFGDNLQSSRDSSLQDNKTHKTPNLLAERGVLHNGASYELPFQRLKNSTNDMIWIHTKTSDGIMDSFSIKVPKMPSVENIQLNSSFIKSSVRCSYLQRKALHMRAISQKQYREYVDLKIAPIPTLADDWSILHPVSCSDIDVLSE